MENVGIFISIWNILVSFGIIYGRLIYCVVILHIFPVLVCLDQEKSGNPVKNNGEEQMSHFWPLAG
jgi:hypothetical protein